ncbi:hypothetical protein JMM81_20750 [Bacillus sp. V3B]|uniref:hypothetical protein n=1 Tax=Bacillus sp. V3B TaxID=2804915 RepID=UPI00210CF57F|nr:hypothetical protein [Bacillus sp. V3B]MCQ6277306.1 hypothetical protein [Bacillus sp. V3B]
MKLFKNEKVEKVNEQLAKLEEKRGGIVKTIEEMEAALEQTVELFALGQISDQDLEEASDFLKARRQELSEVERMIAKVGSVKKKVAIESIPFIREQRAKKVESAQKNVDKSVKEALEAREFYVRKLAAIGQAAKEVDPANSQYNDFMESLGQNRSDLSVNIPHVFPETVKVGLHVSQFLEIDSIGLSKKTQEDAVKSGILPHWVGDSK